jgi:putative glutamine amidotransferase
LIAMPDPLQIGLPCNISPSTERRPFYKDKEIHFNDAQFAEGLLSFRGVLPLFIPIGESEALAEKYIQAVDGLLLTGGRDMSPAFYGEKALAKRLRGEVKRPRFEIRLVRRALQRGLPVLGICQGCQVINVALGGSLYQDIKLQAPGGIRHQAGSQKVADCSHRIIIERESRLGRATGKKEMIVNSAHHQAVKKLGRRLRAAARAEDGIIEAIERAGEPFCLGLQWHAEQMAREKNHRRIFLTFFEACRKARHTSA